jgi:pimeloyl-ACP methyl ester carboxylesterase
MKNARLIRNATTSLAMLAGAVCGFEQPPRLTAAQAATAPAPGTPGCGPAAFLIFERGKLAAVDWVDRTANRIHTRVVETQSHIVDATIDLRLDETAAHSSAVVSTPGGEGEPMKTAHDLGEGAIYWSPRIPSSIEQAIARARILDKPLSKIPGASLYSGSRPEITVDRVDPTDWVVGYQDKKYLVRSNEHGCMLSATMPDYGVVIERRTSFSDSDYLLWPPYSAPPDKAYSAQDVSIRAPQGHVLAGTFTVPAHKDTVAAAVLITGLSPHDRNNGDAPWMPFRDIADALTRAGIAVLRVDDRGIGKSTGDNAKFTSFDKAGDVRTEVAWLHAQPGIDPKRIMLVGYSEGGLIAPMVAATDPSIAGLNYARGSGSSWNGGRSVSSGAANTERSDNSRSRPRERVSEAARRRLERPFGARNQFPRHRSHPIRSPSTLPRAHHSGWRGCDGSGALGGENCFGDARRRQLGCHRAHFSRREPFAFARS